MPGEYIEFIRAQKLALATATYGEVEIPLPTVQMPMMTGAYARGGSVARRALALCIHSIEVYAEDYPAATLDADVNVHISRRTEAASKSIDDPNVIAAFHVTTRLETSGVAVLVQPLEKKFYPPILVSEQKLYLGITHTLGAACDFRVRIGYTLREVTLGEFVNAQLPKN